MSLKSLDLGKEFWHSDEFLSKAKNVLEGHPDVKIIYQPTRIRKDPVSVQMRQIVTDRIRFLSEKAMKNNRKKRRWNFVELMHDYKDLKQKGEDPVTDKNDFRKTIKQKRYKLQKDTVEHLMDEFPRMIPPRQPRRKPKTKVDLNRMSNYYLNRFKIPSRVVLAPVKKDKKSKKRKKPQAI